MTYMYTVDKNGKVTKNTNTTTNTTKKKKKQTVQPVQIHYTVDENGKVTKNNIGDIAPVKKTTTSKSNSKKKNKWYEGYLQLGDALSDGYDFGDITKTAISTGRDFKENFTAGILGMGEKVVDTGAYAVGAVGGLFGADEFKKKTEKFIEKDLYDEKAIAKKLVSKGTDPISTFISMGNPATSMIKSANNNVNSAISTVTGVNLKEMAYNILNGNKDNSILGDKADSLVQSGSQLLATAGLQYLGVPWWLTTGTTSFGEQAETALNEGATYEQAGGSALISAGAEVLFEKLGGGIKFGGKTLDDVMLRPLTEKISNKVLKSTINLGLDATGEGMEEVFTSLVSRAGTSLYKEENIDELLTSEEAMDEYIDSFVGGALLGGVAGAGRVMGNNIDAYTHKSYTDNEQKVIDKEFENRIKEAEEKGKTLTKKEKSELYDKVLNDLNKGGISTDTIESVLGDKTYDTYKNLQEQEDTLKKERDLLNYIYKDQLAIRPNERLKQIDTQIEQLNTAQVKEQLSNEVSELVKDSRLVESYNEKARRSQPFTADLTKYDEKQQETVKRAIDSGVLNNTNRTHELVDLIAKISADKGVLFDFANNQKIRESGFAVEGKTVNGYVTEDGVIGVNVESSKSLNRIVGHEITHVLEGTELYTTLQEAVKKYATTKGEYDTRFKEMTKLYTDKDGKLRKGANIENEVTADLVGDYLFADDDFINNLSTEQPNIFKKIYDEIKYLCKVATAGSKEARQLEKLKRTFEKAYRGSVGKGQNEATNFSLKDIENMTEKSYNHHGWAKVNDVLTNNELADFQEKVGIKKNQNNKWYMDLENGRHMFAVGKEGVNSTLIISDGDYNTPSIEKVYKIDLNNETDIEIVRDVLYENEKQSGWTLSSIATEEIYGNGIIRSYSGKDFETFQEQSRKYKRTKGNGSIKFVEELQDGKGSNTENQSKYSVDNEVSSKDDAFFDAPIKNESNDTKYSLSDSDGNIQELKQKQLSIVQESNPANNDYNAWIRDVDDIMTFEEALNSDDYIDYKGEDFDDSYPYSIAEEALETGKIKVYSSYPIEQGVFVTPSYMEAQSYVGNGKVHSKEVNLTDVAWLDPTQGQYASVEQSTNTDNRSSLSDVDPKRISTNESDVRYSLSYNSEIAKGQTDYVLNKKSYVTESELAEAQKVTNAMVDVMMKYSSILPEDKIGKVLTKNGSYDRSVENTTICVRTLAYNEFVDKVQEEIGRPLTQMESFLVSQKLHEIATDPQCMYCYVSLDRKAFNEMLLRYMNDRDTVIDKYNKSDKSDETVQKLYQEFLNGRKDTKPMKQRFNKWISDVDNGTQLLSLADIATEERQRQIKAKGGDLAQQLADARKYAQGASWSKIQKNYVAYRDEILKLGDRVVKNLNEHYGLRWYSFSDYSPAFIVENMQQITDASIRGLKGLSYTKDTDFAKVFAPSGMNINISVFVSMDENGNFYIDEKQSADLEEAKKLREKYPNVGIVATVARDESLKWAGEQEWCDIIIPFHIVRTGANVAEYYKWLNYTAESSDTIKDKNIWDAYVDSLNLKSENARRKVSKNVYPNEHNNNKDTYLRLCESRGLSPRFVRFAKEDWYMKLVNETRLSAEESQPLKPKYDLESAKESFNKFVQKGGYEGGWYPEGVDVDAEAKAVASDVLAGKQANEVNYGRQDKYNPQELMASRKTNRTHGGVSNVALEKQIAPTATTNVRFSLSEDSNGKELTKEQQEHFKNSKVRDDKGRLLEVYHGTKTNGINIFEYSKNRQTGTDYGEAYYFTSDYTKAMGYSYDIEKDTRVKQYQEQRDKLMEEFLRTKSPAVREEFKNLKVDGKTFLELIDDEGYSTGGEVKKVYLNLTNPLVVDAEGEYYYRVYDEYFKEAKDNGNDGIIVKNVIDNPRGEHRPIDVYIAFKNNQIKNVDNTNPTSDADIRFSLNGEQITAPYGKYDVYGKDVALEKPVQEQVKEVAPVQKPVSKMETSTEDFAPFEESISKQVKPSQNKKIINDAPPTKEQSLTFTTPKDTAKTEEFKEIAKILDTEPKTESQRNNRKWAIFKANVFDKGAVFEDLSLKRKNRELMGKWNYTLYSEARAQRLMGNGNPESNVKSLNDIRAEVENSGLAKQFYEYIYHKHNVDRMKLEERYEGIENKPVFGYDVTAEMSQKIVDQYEYSSPKFMDYAKDIYDYMNYLRQQLVDNGVISQETADAWNEMYPHYVPIRRAGETGLKIDVPLDTNRTGVNAPVKKATGGNADILPLFDTMASRTLQTYKATAKNNFGVELKNTLGTTIENSNINIDEIIDSIDTPENLLQEGKNGKRPTFTVFENGEKVTFEINDDMYDALKPLSNSSFLTKTITPLNVASNIHRGLLTEYNPVFMATNAIKDTQDMLLNSQHPVQSVMKIPEAHLQILKKGYWYNEYMENGGEQNSYFDNETNTFKTENKGIHKLLDMPPFSTISKLNNYIELIPRLSEYIASREAGRSIEVSMLDSARVTTNFRAGGDLTKFLNRNGATFLNASVQGAMQQVRNVREAKANGLKGWANLATKFAIAGLPAIILNSLMWDDDEEYEELSDYVKQNYYVVWKTDKGKFIRIPKGRTIAVIQEAIQQVSNVATGNDEADLKSFLELVVSNLAPNNPLEDNILAPIMQVKNNETWYGEDLVPSRLQDLPSEEQFDESTDSLSKWLGSTGLAKKMDISPVKINYLLDQYSGGVGDVLLPMLTPEAESGDDTLKGNILAPLKSKFTTDNVMNNQNVSDFYKIADELTTNAKKSTATDEDALKNKYFNTVKTELSELYAEKREIQNSDLSDSEKYAKVREIQSQIVDITKKALNTYESVEIDGKFATVGDVNFKLTDENEWLKLTDKQSEKLKTVTKGLGISASEYWTYSNDISKIKADKDSNGKSISGSRKEKVINYINNLDADYGQKIILFRSIYDKDDTYNYEIVDYLNSREDITYDEMNTILKELGFTVKSDGTIYWD